MLRTREGSDLPRVAQTQHLSPKPMYSGQSMGLGSRMHLFLQLPTVTLYQALHCVPWIPWWTDTLLSQDRF